MLSWIFKIVKLVNRVVGINKDFAEEIVGTITHIFVIFMLHCILHAEMIDGPANIREKPKGKAIFTLKDNVEVDLYSGRDWDEIGVYVKVDRKSLLPGERISKNIVLRDYQDREIGKTLEAVHVQSYREEEGGGFLVGYTYKSNIKPETIVERSLEGFIDHSTGPVTIDNLRGHLKRFQYEEWMGEGDILSYLVYENSLEDPSPCPRVILIFHKDVLTAIIYSREIRLKNFLPEKSSQIRQGYNVMYMGNPGREVKKRIEGIYFPILESAD